ncbi:hypothetical protein HDU82_001366 [Entophlyctis luteolus]|nr:hypothetical protein HDU82_001366 [Entophlyctis luteolus]KAJ3389793.1 hypothetical protein HDU84_008284 [Entophlyctis sp. JEL0112]
MKSFLALVLGALFAAAVAAAAATGFGRFIVVYKADTSAVLFDQVTAQITGHGGKVLERYSIINGILVEMPRALAESLVKDYPQVDFVEEDGEVRIAQEGGEADSL